MFNRNRQSFGKLFLDHISCSLAAAKALHYLIANRNRQSFGKLFLDHISCSLAAAKALHHLIANPAVGDPRFEKILECEHQGDEIVRATHELLDRTYITDFDKSDIERLITELDDIVDGIKTVAKRMRNYEISAMPSPAPELAEIIVAMTTVLHDLIRTMSNLKSARIQDAIRMIHAHEETVDDQLSAVLEALYKDEIVNAKRFVALKEIFERLEKITDHCQDVVDVLSSIARKEGR